jgi:energy-coupling factor transport system ATP-binding protein
LKMSDFFRLEEVSFAYPQHGQGLPPLNETIQAGEVVLVSGPSGCGKSTLARCLTGLIPHLYHGDLRGRAWLEGRRTDATPLWQLTRRAGFVFQNPAAQMLAATVEEELIFGLENLGLAPAAIQARAVAASAQFGLDALLDRDPRTLSGGEQQKLALACALARQTPALVLDEPLSMLDTTAAFDFVAHLDGLARSGQTPVICEHRQEYLQAIAGLRTIHLENGSRPAELAGPWPLEAGSGFELQTSHLTVERGGRTILDDLSFSLFGGQMVALVGRNGAGKTTLLRALAGLQPFSGQISVLSGGQSGKPDLGLVFQNPDLQLFNASVREEILYRQAGADPQVYAGVLGAMDLERYEDTPPLLLSEGEKRRVALASVLVRRPRHGILLDEPSLGQDTTHKALLKRVLRLAAQAGYLVVVATHDLELAAAADRMLLLSPHGLLADGPPAEVLHDGAVWERMGLRVPDWVLPC